MHVVETTNFSLTHMIVSFWNSLFFHRLESVYRTWMHMKSTPIDADEGSEIEFRRRELSIALGTAKWQVISRALS